MTYVLIGFADASKKVNGVPATLTNQWQVGHAADEHELRNMASCSSVGFFEDFSCKFCMHGDIVNTIVASNDWLSMITLIDFIAFCCLGECKC